MIAPAEHRHHLRFRALRISRDFRTCLADAMAVLFGLVDSGQPRKLLELCRPRLLGHRHDLALDQLAGEDLAGSQDAGIARCRQ